MGRGYKQTGRPFSEVLEQTISRPTVLANSIAADLRLVFSAIGGSRFEPHSANSEELQAEV
jgi:hypothetical protein